MIKKSIISLAVLGTAFVFTAGLPTVSQAAGIKKCQDADGKWHYGDFADEACAKSVVDQLNESGTKVGEDRPPPTAEEIAEQEALAKLQETENLSAEAQRKKDLEVVRIYGSEETILSTRDRKLASIDNNIDVTRQIKAGTLKDIDKLLKMKQTKKVQRQLEERENAVKSYDRVIRHNMSEREKLAENYITILADFKEAHTRIYGN
ncbi:MAG: hypothetical protein ACR2QW_01155 [bacterium]